ncbi:MAG: hypothetical protein LBD10_06075, partial [Desulfobulbus sp.]|uniref:hypothetical protein n=1 Tax=Desulfobulbus sp. TaxID=895 RepID=UPI0028428A62
IEVDYNRIRRHSAKAVLVLWRLKLAKQLNWMSTQYGQDQLTTNLRVLTPYCNGSVVHFQLRRNKRA